ncbi:MAG: hypothetical protein K2Q06_04215 [Parvularculaceae bacterium]|nr:hypothetical protein [Parvularculaceae bacterium]
MAKLEFFDPEHVDRPVPARPWGAILLGAIAATALLTAGWEVFWRGKGLEPGDFNNTNGLWAEARRHATGDATVMIGSSRILFDVNLDAWEQVSGIRPVQLALEGTSPRIFLKDLADDPSFKGLVIVGVTAPLFFTSDGGLRAEALRYAREETIAQRFDQKLMMPLERVFAFIDEQSRPKRQISIWPLPLREGMKPRFDPRKLESLDADRGARMWSRVETDPAYREEARNQWLIGFQRLAPPPGPDGKPMAMPDAAIDAVIAEVKANVDKIRARGGDVAFVRFPYAGPWAAVEDNGFPRARFWDRLIRETDSLGIAWQDHPELQGYDLPEWSHLSAREAERYTRALAPIFYREYAARRAASGKP